MGYEIAENCGWISSFTGKKNSTRVSPDDSNHE